VLVAAWRCRPSSRTRARQAPDAERENKRNQESILRLLNEMGDLADGDSP
jgi:twitching motility protein PilJ